MIPAQEARVIVRPTERGSPVPEVVTPTERGSPAPEAHRTIAGGKRGEAERAHRMGRAERNIRPGGAAEPTRDKILLRPRGGSLLGGDPLPVGALGFASLPNGYCPLRLPAPGNITIT